MGGCRRECPVAPWTGRAGRPVPPTAAERLPGVAGTTPPWREASRYSAGAVAGSRVEVQRRARAGRARRRGCLPGAARSRRGAARRRGWRAAGALPPPTRAGPQACGQRPFRSPRARTAARPRAGCGPGRSSASSRASSTAFGLRSRGVERRERVVAGVHRAQRLPGRPGGGQGDDEHEQRGRRRATARASRSRSAHAAASAARRPARRPTGRARPASRRRASPAPRCRGRTRSSRRTSGRRRRRRRRTA